MPIPDPVHPSVDTTLIWDIWGLSGLDLLDASAEAALVIARDGTIVYCNHASEQLQRRTRDQIVGRSLGDFSTGAVPVDPSSEIWQRVIGGEHWSGDVWVNRGDGAQVPVYVTRSPLFGADGKVVGVLSLATDRTRELEAKQALQASEQRFRALVQRSSDIALLFRRDGTILYVSPSIEPISGLRVDQLLGSNGWDYLHPDDRDDVTTAVQQRLAPDRPVTGEWRMMTATGWRWFEMTLTDQIDVPAIGGLVGNLRDITEQRDALEALRTMAERFRRIFDESPVGKMIVDTDLRVVEVNQALCESLRYTTRHLEGASIDRLVHPSEAEDQRARWQSLFAGDIDQFQVRLRYVCGDGSEVVARVTASALHDERGAALTGICEVEDVTEQVRADAELTMRALTDPLTRLPNRALLHDRLSRALARLSRETTLVAVLFLDIDRFKPVNDALGHGAGDDLLVKIASRLSQAVRATDTVSRVGGDEFVVVAEDLEDAEQVLALGERLVKAVSEPFVTEGQTMTPTASIGIAMTSDFDTNPSSLVRKADLAMYKAKELGGARCVVHETLTDD
jgi:diguanylate cyclase (GGDEF)-like protein/PAS domain S-box-containing protein